MRQVTYNMATSQERNARGALERVRNKVEALIEHMETASAANPTSTTTLQRKLKNTEKAWTELEGHYDRLRAITGENWDEEDGIAYNLFQRRYLRPQARAEDVLDEAQETAEVRPRILTSAQKIQQYTIKRKGSTNAWTRP